jgi:pentatricopeptide repeat protein
MEINILIIAVSVLGFVGLIMYLRGGKKVETELAHKLVSEALEEKRKGSTDHMQYLLERALQQFESGAVDDMSKYSTCIVNLADCYTKTGKFDQARELYKRMLARWQTVINSRDQARLLDIDYFAATADFGSGIADVANFYRRIIEAKKQIFGANHPEVANSMILCSRLLAKAGERAEAQKLETEANQLRGLS